MSKNIKTYFHENAGILAALVALCILLAILPATSKSFVSTRNFFNVLRQVSTNMFLACGMTMVIILGGIDLSVGSIIALAGCVEAGMVVHLNMPLPLAILIALAIGLGVGMFNGYVVSTTTIPAFIVTLATMNICRGLAYVYTGGSPVRVMTDAWKFIGAGYHIYAVGGNAQAAEYSGIKVRKVKFLVHSYSGLMAGLAGVVLASRMYSGQPTAGDGAEMDAIAATVVGGTSMAGGSGKIGGTIVGALIIGVLNNGLNLMNVNSFWQYVVKGVVILGAVYVDFLRNKNKK